eukprot:6296321-Karenia_brevis.AAC.1
MRWVDTNKSHMKGKGGDKGRDALFAETPPLEAKRMLFRRAVTMREDGKGRKFMFVDVKKTHLNPVCEEDFSLELPEECNCPPG